MRSQSPFHLTEVHHAFPQVRMQVDEIPSQHCAIEKNRPAWHHE